MRHPLLFGFLFLLISCGPTEASDNSEKSDTTISTVPEDVEKKQIDSPVFLEILGTVQDGGSPHLACKRGCCDELIDNPDLSRKVVCLGLVDKTTEQSWMFEATPDFTTQCKILERSRGFGENKAPNGIFLTHAHIGHYVGLMFLGKEAMNSNQVPVYAMPRMSEFLETNGPWSQLVSQENIALMAIQNEESTDLTSSIKVVPILVPHRDEYSETVGYRIIGPEKSALFIPDINKWEIWEKKIEEEIAGVDYAFLDATFYGPGELLSRSMDEIPHPFVIESMERFEGLSKEEKDKVYFIHINHSNPILNTDSEEYQTILENGYHVAQFGDQFPM